MSETFVKFDTAAAEVGTVFFNERLNVFVRKIAADDWDVYLPERRRTLSDAEARDGLTECDVYYESTAITGAEPVDDETPTDRSAP